MVWDGDRARDGGAWRERGGKDAGKGSHGTCRVFFKNLLFETPQNFLLDMFKAHGEVNEFFLRRNSEGRSKGAGVCEYSHPAEARRAVAALADAEVDGRVMSVELEDLGRGSSKGGGEQRAFESRSSAQPSSGKGAKPGELFRIFFRNLLFETPNEFVLDLFKKHGQIVDHKFFLGTDGRQKGMGRIDFATPGGAKRAVNELHGAEVDGRVLSVEHDDGRSGPKGGGKAESSSKGGGKNYDGGGKSVDAKGGGYPSSGKGAAKSEERFTVFFKNVLFETPNEFLLDLFKKYGQVVDHHFFLGSDGRQKGGGFVAFATPGGAKRAVNELNGAEVDGRQLMVEHDKLGGKVEGGGKGAGKSHGAGGKGKAAEGKGGADCRLFFKNVPYETTGKYLTKLFRQFGWVLSFDLRMTAEGRSIGAGTVEYPTSAEARMAIQGLHGAEVDGRPISVEPDRDTRGAGASYGPKGSKGKGRPGPY